MIRRKRLTSRRRSPSTVRPRLEALESREMMAVEALTVADPSLWGDSGFGPSSKPNFSGDGRIVVFQSDAPNLVPNDTNNQTDVFAYDRDTGRVSLVSASSAGIVSANGPSIDPRISADGRFVVFRSNATNVVAAPLVTDFPAIPGQYDLYVRDLATGTTEMVSASFDGQGSAGLDCTFATISEDGRYVTFQTGSDRILPGDTNQAADVFRRDLLTDTTELVSMSISGGFGSDDSYEPQMTTSGRHVLFTSIATNLYAFDSGFEDIFVRDMQTGVTQIVTVDPNFANTANGNSTLSDRSISDDGRYVTFASTATNLVAESPTGQMAFIRDLQTNTTRTLARRNATTAAAADAPVLTPDGAFAVFSAPDGVLSDKPDSNNSRDVFRAAISPSSIDVKMISVNSAGTSSGNRTSGGGSTAAVTSVSSDGRYVAFVSQATNLLPGTQASGAAFEVYVRDVTAATTILASRNAQGGISGETAVIVEGELSPDGQSMAFAIGAAGMAPRDVNRDRDVFVFDLQTSAVELVSRRGTNTPPELLVRGGDAIGQDVSSDGRYSLFTSTATFDLSPQYGPAPGLQLFLRDRLAETIELVSLKPNGSPSTANIERGLVSDDGRFVAFATPEGDLDASVNAPNGGVYLRDRVTGVNKLVNRNPASGLAANASASLPAISTNGQYVAFTSRATNLIDGVSANGREQLYLFDRATGSLRMVSASSAGTAAGNGNQTSAEYAAVFSQTGGKLVFVSNSSDLVAGVSDTNGALDVFAYDIASQSLELVSESLTPGVAPNSRSGDASRRPRISADGRTVVFGSLATNLIAGVTRSGQLYARDLETNATSLVTVNRFGDDANGGGNSAEISGDGRYVTFASTAADLVSTPINLKSNVFVRDLVANTMTLVSLNTAGTAGGNANSSEPQISVDGSFVAFRSLATDLAAGHVSGNGGAQEIYLRDLTRQQTAAVTMRDSGTATANSNQTGAFALGTALSSEPVVTFISDATDLVRLDNNGIRDDAFAYVFHGFASIEGALFRDDDGDGSQAAGEPGLAYRTIYLDGNGNGRFDAGETSLGTDANGRYRFNNLAAGEYQVALVLDEGYEATAPATSRHLVMLDDGESATGIDFGARQAPVDLVVDGVFAPLNAQPGEPVTIQWLVRNLGASMAAGAWQDAVYLSSDPVLDASDRLLTTKLHAGGLAGSSSYVASAVVVLPALNIGNQYVIVETDRRRQATADRNVANNLQTRVEPIAIEVADLPLNTSTAGQFTGDWRERYYRVEIAAGETLDVSLDSAATTGGAELYLRRAGLPAPDHFDFVARGNGQDQRLSVPVAEPGVYYVLARAAFGAVLNSGFNIMASATPLRVDSIGPSAGGNLGRVTVELRGSRFTANTIVSLLGAATAIPAESIDLRDSTLLYATFDLSGQPLGAYDVHLVDGAATDTLPLAFTVEAGVSAVNALSLNLITPEFSRIGRTGRAIVEYANTSNVDIAAPLLQLKTTNALVKLPEQSLFVDNSVTFLGISHEGPAGVLRPGQRASLEIDFQVTGPAGSEIEAELFSNAPGEWLDWQAIKDEFRPGHIPVDAWEAVFANILLEAGTTTDNYEDMLARHASYLSSVGVYTADVVRLLNLAIDAADANHTAGSLASVLDSSQPASGFALAFARAHQQPIHGRYAIGPFGRGWTHNWDIQAITLDGGDVVIRSGGSRRFFFRLANGSYRGSPGDTGVLTLAAGQYRLAETSGEEMLFRADGRFEFVEDAKGNRVAAGYDGSGRLLSLTHTSGATINFAYNPAGRLGQLTDSAGRLVNYNYDPAGEHLIGYSDQYGSHAYSYVTGQGAASEHALAAVDFSDDTHVNFTYDVRGRLTSEERDGGQERLTYAYPAPGIVTVTNAIGGSTTQMYDDHGQLARQIDPLGRSVDFRYDGQGNLIAAIMPGGVEEHYAYDSRGNLIESLDAAGNATRFAYDDRDNLTSFTDALSRTTHYAYDAENNLLAIDYVNGTRMSNAYDERGIAISSTNRRGRTIGYEYNAAGQVTKKTLPDGRTIDYVYNARGQLILATDESGVIDLDYTPLDTLERVTYPDGKFLAFQYNVVGLRTQLVDQDGFTVNYAYDDLGRLDRLTDGAGSLIVDYSFDAAGRMIRKDNGNLTHTEYVYDLAGQLLRITHFAPSGAINAQLDYLYDSLGRRVRSTLTDGDAATADGDTNYAYDPFGQLVSVSLPGGRVIAYQYDAVGNRIAVNDSGVVTNYTTNDVNEYTQVGEASFTYDADGNLIGRTDDSGTVAYAFDDENRLIGIAGAGLDAAYVYNALGHRSAETIDGATLSFLIDPTGLWSIAAEYDGANTAIARYTYGAGLLSRVAADGSAGWYDHDGSSNTIGITNDAGDYVNRYSYRPFGEMTVHSSAVANPFTFVGQFGVRLAADGQFDMRHRNFDPETGAFLSNDPLGIGGGDFNLRRYVGNDPNSGIDPMGLSKWKPIWDVYDLIMHSPGAQMIEQHNGISMDAEVVKMISGPVTSAAKACEKAYKDWESKAKKNLNNWQQYGKLHWDSFIGIFGHGGPHNSSSGGAGGKGKGVGNSCNCDCPPGFVPPPTHPGPKKKVGLRGTGDPNDITGPAGFGDARFIQPDQILPFTIRFENVPTATTAVQEVFITHQLDADLDWTTFEVGDMGFGTATVETPSGRQAFSTRAAYTNLMAGNTPLLVDISARVDLQTGVVLWTFLAVDPATGLLPEGVFDGFLPPEDGTGIGQGVVNYTIRPRKDAATGVRFDQQAGIVFDVNEPVITNVWTNSIDAEAPTSSVAPLPPVGNFRSFPVSWTSDDGLGSGAVSYDVFVSIDSGAFALWLDDTALSEELYPGAFGHSYAFYCMATDGVGYVEAAPLVPDAVTQLVDPATVEFIGGQIVVQGGPDFDNVTFFPGASAGQVRVRVNGRLFGPFASPSKLVAFGQGGNDRISIDRVDGMPAAEFHGGPGNDRLYGAYAADMLYGDDGRDYLEGFNGHDRLFGGEGDDLLQGGNGNDVLYGEGGNDRLRGYVGNDLLFGGAGRDYLNGDDGNNVLVGGDANDRLGAVEGRNILISGLGRDIAQGGSGGSILISGNTTHDAGEAALLALLAEWSSTRTLDQRVARLTAGVGSSNQYRLTFNGTVQNDNAWSTLEGGAGEDWFFKYRKDSLLAADPLIDEITQ